MRAGLAGLGSAVPGAEHAAQALRDVESRLVGVVASWPFPALARTLDLSINRARIEVKGRRAALRPTVVLPYRGWYADGVAHMTARTVEKPLVTVTEDPLDVGSTLRASLRRFLILTMSGVTVRASLGEATTEVTSDSDGYLHIELAVGALTPGWHAVTITPLSDTVQGAVGRVLVTDPRGGTAVVSDIDDTIMKTGVTQRWTAAGRTLLRDVTDRRPVPGMATFYAGLSRGDGSARPAPFFYVSTGSWNLYDYLVVFTRMHRFPRGPLFLTDWGPTGDRLMRDGSAHKHRTISALVAGNPQHSFVLIGDVGQGDPETYEKIAREYPGRISAIFVVYVGSHLAHRSEAVADRAAALRGEDIPMYYVDSAAEAATVAWQLGLVDRETTALIARELAPS